MPIELRTQPPAEALAFFEGKGLLVTGSWQSLWNEEHARAFTVANLARVDLLQEIQGALLEAIKEGKDYRAFEKALVPKLQAAGWWSQPVPDGKPLTPSRLKLIYDTNLRMSYAASNWARIQRLKGRRPFLRYRTMEDRRVRPAHAAWDGIVRPVGDLFWDTHFPPNGWRCRCTTEQLGQSDLDAEGLQVTPDSALPTGGTTFVNKMTGEATQVPTGIDPGFAYNPGKAGQVALLDQARQKLEGSHPIAREAGVKGLVESPAFEAWASQPSGAFPVMAMATEIQAALGSDAAIAVLPPEALPDREQAPGGLDLPLFRLLPDLGLLADLVIEGQAGTFLVLRSGDGYLVATLEVTSGTPARALVTAFHRQTEADVVALRRQGTVRFERGAGHG